MPNKADQLKSILSLLSASVTKQEVMDAFKQLMQFVQTIKQKNDVEWSVIKVAFARLESEVKNDAKADVEEATANAKQAVMDYALPLMEKMMAEHDAKMLAMDAKMDAVEDGKDADEEMIVANVLKQIPPVVFPIETSEDIRNKLELLQADERLDKSAVKGIERLEEDIKAISLRPVGRGGGKGIGLFVGGSKKLLTAQTINLVAGTGITISYAYASGRNDITISASGTVALSPIAMTGTIDDSNKSFTAASTPTLVVVNGTAYRDGHGVSIVGTAITLDNPCGAGGDLYGL